MGLFRKSKVEVIEDIAEELDVPSVGPFDSMTHVPSGLIDCGALMLPPVAGYEVQFAVERSRDMVLGVVFTGHDSAVQLQVFAAPKSAGIWDDVCADMMMSIASQGGASKEADGMYGKEIRALMPIEGSKNVNPVRYIGIDGARWLLRVTVTGRAGVDDELCSEVLHEILDPLVVVRGNEPHPPREILPLRIPKVKETLKDERPSRELPQRGPEITEVH